MIYFCHIPKTSGSSVEAALDHYQNDIKYVRNLTSAEQMGEEVFDRFLNKRKNDDFIRGHFGTTPIEKFPGIKSFSIVRNPIDRLISSFSFSQRPITWRKPFKDVLYDYCKYNNPSISSLGFDGRPNIQSDYLTQPLEWTSDEDSSVSIKKGNLSFSDLLKEIKKNNFTLSTLDNRKYLLRDMSEELTNLKNKSIILNEEIKVNDNPFKLDAMSVFNNFYDEICDLHKLDFDLYNHIKEHESRTGRALRPADIDI
jgi:hypothetical protein